MRAVALTLCISLVACFPNNPRARTISKISEGGAVLAGIVLLAVSNSGADCEAKGQPGVPDSNCRSNEGAISDIGLGLILVGLAGFIATVSTTPDDKPPQPILIEAPKPDPKPEPPKPATAATPSPGPATSN
jgi:hypothetical protein